MKLSIAKPDDDDDRDRWRVVAPGEGLELKLILEDLPRGVSEFTVEVRVDGVEVPPKQAQHGGFHVRPRGRFAVLKVEAEALRKGSSAHSLRARQVEVVVACSNGGGGDRASARILVVPRRQSNVAMGLTFLALAVAAIAVIGLARDQSLAEWLTRATGSAVVTGIVGFAMPRLNAFKLPFGGLPYRWSRAALALVLAVTALLVPRFTLVRIYNRTDRPFELPRDGTSTLTIAKRGWTTAYRFDRALDANALKRWFESAELRSAGFEPCLFWDVPSGMSKRACGGTEDPRGIHDYLFAGEMGIDCKSRIQLIPKAALAKDCASTGEFCALELRTQDCKPVGADYELRHEWVFAPPPDQFCNSATPRQTKVVARLPFEQIEKRASVVASKRLCVHDAKGFGFAWRRSTELEASTGVTAVELAASDGAVSLMPVPAQEHAESISLSIENKNHEMLGSLRCDGAGHACLAVHAVTGNVDVQALDTSRTSLKSRYEARLGSPNAHPWFCVAPVEGCAEKSDRVIGPADAEVVLSRIGSERPYFSFGRDRTPRTITLREGDRRLGELTCQAARNRELVIERVDIDLLGSANPTVETGDREKLGWQSTWNPTGTAIDGNARSRAWVCRDSAASNSKVQARVGPVKAVFDVGAGVVRSAPNTQVSVPTVETCLRCNGPGRKPQLETCRKNDASDRPTQCSAEAWKLCECDD